MSKSYNLEKTNYPSVYKRKRADGGYTFFIKYIDELGKNKRVKVDSLTAKEANRKLQDAKGLVADIKAGKASAQIANVDTLNALSDEFFRERTTKTNHKDIQSYNKYVRNGLGEIKHPIPTLAVERFQIKLKSMKIVNRNGVEATMAPATINLITDLVRSIINWGLKHRLIGYTNPFIGLKREKVSNERDRWFSKSELEDIFEFNGVVLDEKTGLSVDAIKGKKYKHYLIQPLTLHYKLLFKLAYYTASRPVSFLGLKLDDIEVASRDTNDEKYMKPLSIYFSPVKEGKGYTVPVSPKLETVLWARLLEMVELGEDTVIPMTYTRIQKTVSAIFGYLFNGGFRVESRAWMGLEDYTAKGEKKKFVTFNGRGMIEPNLITDDRRKALLYTMRHSAASHIVAETGSLPLAGEVLNHTSSKMTERYAKIASQAKIDAVGVL